MHPNDINLPCENCISRAVCINNFKVDFPKKLIGTSISRIIQQTSKCINNCTILQEYFNNLIRNNSKEIYIKDLRNYKLYFWSMNYNWFNFETLKCTYNKVPKSIYEVPLTIFNVLNKVMIKSDIDFNKVNPLEYKYFNFPEMVSRYVIYGLFVFDIQYLEIMHYQIKEINSNKSLYEIIYKDY